MGGLSKYNSPLGEILLSSDGETLTGLRFADQLHAQVFVPPPDTEATRQVFEETRRWLDLYFSGRIPGFTPPLSLSGTPFQKAVWELLTAVPYGETRAYGDLARQLSEKTGRPVAAQAVGQAVSRNPVAVVVPCHRIIGADGSLTGYAGGLERKRALLALERTSSLHQSRSAVCFQQPLRKKEMGP